LSLILIGLMASVLLSLGVPLGTAIAASTARTLYLDRLGDVSRFAGLVPQTPTPVDEQALRDELQRYDALYGIQVAVLDTEGTVRAASRAHVSLSAEQAEKVVTASLAGRRADPPGTVLPWDDRPMAVGQTLVEDGDVVGAVVSISATDRARGDVLRSWALLALVEGLALLVGVTVAGRLATWVLRPVDVLDDAAHRISRGDLSARVPEAGGPPELRRLGSSFNDMAEHVQTVVETQRAFVADAGHQLRNPLGALLIRLEGLALSSTGAAADAAERAAQDGRYLADTLDRMLELARVENAAAQPTAIDVGEVVDRRLDSWSVVAERRSVVLRREGRPHVLGWHDADALAGAVDAVVDNALKFSPEGGRVVVTVSAGPQDGAGRAGVLVTVSDEGPGLDDTDMTRVADRFWRSRQHQNEPGSGLGMSIARALLERHGGTLAVESAPSGGLCVTLGVRACPDAEPATVRPPDGGGAANGQGLVSR
jgi:signal transduction histidine kinase